MHLKARIFTINYKLHKLSNSDHRPAKLSRKPSATRCQVK